MRVREGDQTDDKVNEIPEQLRKRTLAVKSSKEMMVDNRLVDGLQIEPVIEERWLAPSNVDYAYSLCGSWLCVARVERTGDLEVSASKVPSESY